MLLPTRHQSVVLAETRSRREKDAPPSVDSAHQVSTKECAGPIRPAMVQLAVFSPLAAFPGRSWLSWKMTSTFPPGWTVTTGQKRFSPVAGTAGAIRTGAL